MNSGLVHLKRYLDQVIIAVHANLIYFVIYVVSGIFRSPIK